MARSAHLHRLRLITRHGQRIKAKEPNTWTKHERDFIKTNYPDFYRHAFPGGGGGSSGSGAGRSGYPLTKPAISTPETVGLPFPIDHAVEEAYKINARGTTPGQEQEWNEITKSRNPQGFKNWVKEVARFNLPGIETHMSLGDVVQTGDIKVTKVYRLPRDFHKDLLRRQAPRGWPEPRQPPEKPDTDKGDGDNRKLYYPIFYGFSIKTKKGRSPYKLETNKTRRKSRKQSYRGQKGRYWYSSGYH